MTACLSSPLTLNAIEKASTFKLLGVYFNSDLTVSNHVHYIVAKASKRICCFTELVRTGVVL